jgi:2-isopropylmalate synthase
VVVDYAEHAVTSGTDAAAAAYVRLSVDGQRVSGTALDHDTVTASLMAVIAALNRAAPAPTCAQENPIAASG